VTYGVNGGGREKNVSVKLKKSLSQCETGLAHDDVATDMAPLFVSKIR